MPAQALALLRAGTIEVVTLTSSSTARNLVALLGGDLAPLAGAVIACIGPRTAETARDLGLTPSVVAEEHTVPGLVAALRAYLHSGGHSGTHASEDSAGRSIERAVGGGSEPAPSGGSAVERETASAAVPRVEVGR